MDRAELLSRIATFPLVASELSASLLSGDFRSVFKAQGIEFDEVRPYARGDDARTIDWNVSARMGSPYIKLYREEKELTVFAILDGSASMHTGGRWEQTLLAAALLAFSAEKAGERFGGELFAADLDRTFPPRKGRGAVFSFIEAALDYNPGGEESALGRAMAGASRSLKRRSLVLVFSDFLAIGWEEDLGRLSRRHDVVAVRMTSPSDTDLLPAGLLQMRDPETGISLSAPTGFSSFRAAWNEAHRERAAAFKTACLKRGAATLEISTADDPLLTLCRFFGSRRRA